MCPFGIITRKYTDTQAHMHRHMHRHMHIHRHRQIHRHTRHTRHTGTCTGTGTPLNRSFISFHTASLLVCSVSCASPGGGGGIRCGFEPVLRCNRVVRRRRYSHCETPQCFSKFAVSLAGGHSTAWSRSRQDRALLAIAGCLWLERRWWAFKVCTLLIVLYITWDHYV